jgi:hypothetical protein
MTVESAQREAPSLESRLYDFMINATRDQELKRRESLMVSIVALNEVVARMRAELEVYH